VLSGRFAYLPEHAVLAAAKARGLTFVSRQSFFDIAAACLGANLTVEGKPIDSKQPAAATAASTARRLPSLLFPTVDLSAAAREWLEAAVMYTFQTLGRDAASPVFVPRPAPACSNVTATTDDEQQPQQQQQLGASSSSGLEAAADEASSGSADAATTATAPGKYVPPSKRPGTVAPAASASTESRPRGGGGARKPPATNRGGKRA
jgi:hypothetical protein